MVYFYGNGEELEMSIFELHEDVYSKTLITLELRGLSCQKLRHVKELSSKLNIHVS
jgi:hypothetical protein